MSRILVLYLIFILLSHIASEKPNDLRNPMTLWMQGDLGNSLICPWIRQSNQSVLLVKTQYFKLLVANHLASQELVTFTINVDLFNFAHCVFLETFFLTSGTISFLGLPGTVAIYFVCSNFLEFLFLSFSCLPLLFFLQLPLIFYLKGRRLGQRVILKMFVFGNLCNFADKGDLSQGVSDPLPFSFSTFLLTMGGKQDKD